MKPITSSIVVGVPIEDVFARIDRLVEHEAWTDHMLVEWSASGPETGVGARARVRGKAPGRPDWLDIEVLESTPPRRTVERTIGAGGARVSTGTYELEDLGDGHTRVTFTLAFERLPRRERALWPLVALYLRSVNGKAMKRLAEQLGTAPR